MPLGGSPSTHPPNLNIAWQSGRKGVPGLGCSPQGAVPAGVTQIPLRLFTGGGMGHFLVWVPIWVTSLTFHSFLTRPIPTKELQVQSLGIKGEIIKRGKFCLLS